MALASSPKSVNVKGWKGALTAPVLAARNEARAHLRKPCGFACGQGYAPTPPKLRHFVPPPNARPPGVCALTPHSVATFHTHVNTTSRSAGHTATAAAAYRAGLKMVDERTGEIHDYTRRGGVVESLFAAPPGSPDWSSDPAKLWNAAEAAEKKSNARVAREFEVSLPHELTDAQRRDLVKDIAQSLVARYGFAVQASIHRPDKKGDQRNHHVHILATTRRMTPSGLGEKTRELDDKVKGPAEITASRELISERINAHLMMAARPERVTHKSHTTRAVEAEAAGDFALALAMTRTPTQHEGKAVTAAKRRGRVLDRALENQERVQSNRDDLAGHLRAARAETRSKAVPAAPRRAAAAQPMAARPAPLPAVRAKVGGGKIHSAGKTASDREQASMADDAVKLAEQQTRAFLDMLDETAKKAAKQYARIHAMTGNMTEELAETMTGNRWGAELVKEAVKAHENYVHARDRPERRRAVLGRALAATGFAAERHAEWEKANPKPGAFNPLDRRHWAARRAEQAKEMEQLKHAEQVARHRTGPGAQNSYAELAKEAETAWKKAEKRRRETMKLPHEQARDEELERQKKAEMKRALGMTPTVRPTVYASPRPNEGGAPVILSRPKV